jgi:ATP-dependent Clp protease protease subunit
VSGFNIGTKKMFSKKGIKRASIKSPMYMYGSNPQKKRRPHPYKRNTDQDEEDDDDGDEEGGDERGPNPGNFGNPLGGQSVFCIENTIYFRAVVNAQSVGQLVNIINIKNMEYDELKRSPLLKNTEPGELILRISSYGGSLFQGFIAYDSIVGSRVPIVTIVDGFAASAASLMSVAGTKRYMTASSYILVHQLSSQSGGNFQQLKDSQVNNEKMMDDIKRIYLKHTKISSKKLTELLKHDLWLRPDECLDFGLIDEVYTGQGQE